MNVGEVWKDIKDFPNYQISNFGRVKSKGRYRKVGIKNVDKVYRKEFIINGYINKKGYKQVTLYDKNGKPKTMRIHRLVAMNFIDNKNNKSQINHKDGNKLNNHVNNLEWCSDIENKHHAIENGLVDLKLREENMRKTGQSLKGHIARFGLTENIKKKLQDKQMEAMQYRVEE